MTAVTMRSRVDGNPIDWQGPITTTISALMAVVCTVPLATMIASSVEVLVEQAPGEHGNPLALVYLLLAPLGYCIFAAATWSVMRERASTTVFTRTVRAMAFGLLPYVVLTLVGIGWTAGPRLPLVTAGALTIPAAVLGTIWASARTN